MLAAIALSTLLLCTSQPGDDRLDWIKARSFPFHHDEAGHGFDDLEPLRAIIGGARIVSLGEPTHGTRECFQFKHRLLEFLASEMGFTIFSIEASMPEAALLTAYVLGGEGNPRALIAGMNFWTWNTEEVLEMVEWMRVFNAERKESGSPHRITFTGFDMQFEAAAMKNARALVAQVDPAFLETLDKAFARVPEVNEGGRAPPTGIVAGTFPVEAARGKKITFAGWIRTEAVRGFAGLWWRVDGVDGVLAFNNMQDRGISGNQDWTHHQIALDVPQEATNINFGVLVHGGGDAWFDGLTLDIGESTFRNPDLFDLDFEGPDHQGLRATTPGTRVSLDKARVKSGAKSLRVRVRPEMKKIINAAEVLPEVQNILSHMEKSLQAYGAKAGADKAAWGVQNARIVAQSLRCKALMNGGDPSRTDEWGRDASMAANVKWLLDQNPDSRIVLWAHNGHVARSPHCMGAYLEKSFPGEMIVIGFATGYGRYQAIGNQGLGDHPLLPPPPQSLESHLDALGQPRMIFDMRTSTLTDASSAWLRIPLPFRLVGARAMQQQFFPRPVGDEYDLMVWQRDTTRARPLSMTMKQK